MKDKIVTPYCHKYKSMARNMIANSFRENIKNMMNTVSIEHMSDEGFMEYLTQIINSYNLVMEETQYLL